MSDPARTRHFCFAVYSRTLVFKTIAVLCMVSVGLSGCGYYRSSLQYPEGAPADEVRHVDALAGDPRFIFPEGFEPTEDTELTLPLPVKSDAVVPGDPKLDNPTGWVHFLFDVDETGEISNVTVHRSSDASLEFVARQIINEWEFRPATVDGQPVAFKDMEIVMGFSKSTSPGKVIGVGLAVIVLLPLALLAIVLGAAMGFQGSVSKS